MPRIRQKLGAVLMSMARYQQAFEVLEQAATVFERAGDLESLGQTVVETGRLHVHLGTPLEGIPRIESLLSALTQRDTSAMNGAATHTLGRLYAALAPLRWLLGQYEEQLDAAERAEELARSVGDAPTLARATLWGAVAHHMLGQLEQSHQQLEEAVPVLEAIGDLEALGTAFDVLSVAYACAGDVERSFACASSQIELAERQGDPVQIAYANAQASQLRFFAGAWSVQRRCIMRQVIALPHLLSPSSVPGSVWPPDIARRGYAICSASSGWWRAERTISSWFLLRGRWQSWI